MTLPTLTPLGFVHSTDADATSLHAMHAYKLVVPLDAPLYTTLACGRVLETRSPVLAAPHLEQAMASPGRTMAMFWAPERFAGLDNVGAGGAPLAIGGARGRWLREAAWSWRDDLGQPEALLTEVASRLGGAAEGRRYDRRVARAQALLAQAPGKRLELEVLAADVGLSASRLSHVFRAQVGTTLRRYALWLRTHDAMGALFAGATIAGAAAEAGFSDHAHFTRSLRRFMGQPPSYVLTLRDESS